MLCLTLPSMFFQYVNERAADVKVDRDSHWCRPGQ